MKTLAECPNNVVCEGRTWRGSLQERKGGLRLEVSGSAPFALHLLDDDALIPNGERSDGVLMTDAPPVALTCFVELKGAIDPADPDHPFRQIRGAIEHFAPVPGGAAHGEEHHVAWRSRADLPEAPPRGRGRSRALAVGPQHVVAGLIVMPRAGTRLQPRWMTIAGRDVFVAVLPRHGNRGAIPLTTDEIEEALR